MADPQVNSFEPAPKGRQYEDFEIGQELSHHWGRTVTEADNVTFASVTHAFAPMYFNAEFARAHDHPDMVISPMLVLCTVVGLSVEDLSEGGGPFLGVEDVVFHAPVYPGDTLTAASTVTSKRLSSKRPGTGIISWRTEGRNQKGDLVVSYERTNLSFLRNPDGEGNPDGERG